MLLSPGTAIPQPDIIQRRAIQANPAEEQYAFRQHIVDQVGRIARRRVTLACRFAPARTLPEPGFAPGKQYALLALFVENQVTSPVRRRLIFGVELLPLVL